MSHIDYFFSPISPFTYTYLADSGLEEIVREHEATVTYKPIGIIMLFSRTGGTPPAQSHPLRQEYHLQELQRQSKKQRLPITLKLEYFPTNATPSSYAIIAAQADSSGDVGGLVQYILSACWAEEKDIAQDDVIKDCLRQAGFDPALADSGLLSGAETYLANLEKAVICGVFGAPFYIVDDGPEFWGQDRLNDLDAHLAGEF
ncbi:MAG: 2-hydroxychromene-2-carboxylate isomerase [Paracoccaceae bacterium]|nr:2-hydroxychromene-2-carboxylate isomerase [Paracoccaceae bacterium]